MNLWTLAINNEVSQYPENYLLLGDWCIAGSPFVSKSKFTQFVDHPWHNRGRLENDYYLINEAYRNSLTDLTVFLNEQHGLQWSERGWEVLIGTWLKISLNICYEVYLLMDAARKHGPNSVSIESVCLERSFFTDTATFFDLIPKFRQFVIKEYLRLHWPEITVFEKKDNSVGGPRKSVNSPVRAWLKESALFGLKTVVLLNNFIANKREKIELGFGLSYADEFIRSIRSGNLPRFFLGSFHCTDNAIQKQKEIDIRLPNCTEGWHLFWSVTALKYIPTFFLENFKEAVAFVKANYPMEVRRITTSVSYYKDDTFKLYAALNIANNCQYSIKQHGGGFGFCKLNDEQDLIMSTADIFFTWGWEKKTSSPGSSHVAHTVPYQLEVLPKRFRRRKLLSKNIIVPLDEWMLCNYRIFEAHMSHGQLRYINDVLQLFKLADSQTRANLKLLMPKTDRGWHLRDRLIFAGLGKDMIVEKVPFNSLVGEASASILFSNSTTVIESMLSNTPTLALVPKKVVGYAECHQLLFNELFRLEVFHDNIESLVCVLNQNQECLDTWWLDEKRQNIRRLFLERFGGVTNN